MKNNDEVTSHERKTICFSKDCQTLRGRYCVRIVKYHENANGGFSSRII